MSKLRESMFDCQIYVPAFNGPLAFRMPSETGPRRAITLNAIDYDQLIDPEFRRLLIAFDTVPQPLQVVQV